MSFLLPLQAVPWSYCLISFSDAGHRSSMFSRSYHKTVAGPISTTGEWEGCCQLHAACSQRLLLELAWQNLWHDPVLSKQDSLLVAACSLLPTIWGNIFVSQISHLAWTIHFHGEKGLWSTGKVTKRGIVCSRMSLYFYGVKGCTDKLISL